MDKINKEEVKQLISETNQPCISMYMPTEKSEGNAYNKMKIRFKNLTRTARKKLKENWGMNDKEVDDLLEPLVGLENDKDFWLDNQSQGLAFYISPEQYKLYRLPVKFEEEIKVGENFDFRQIVPAVFENNSFYLLTLSRNNTRIFYCDDENIEKLELEDLPASFEEIFETGNIEVNIQRASSSTGGDTGIYHGQGGVEGDTEEDLLQYFRLVDEAVTPYLNQFGAPLALMCVEEIYSYYEKANSYENLLETFVKGSPGKMTKDEIYEQAKDVILPELNKEKENAIEKYSELISSEKTENDLEKILPDTIHGKVEFLLLSNSANKNGNYDLSSDKIIEEEPDHDFDLYNYAVLNTILNGGKVYLLSDEQMPDGSDIGAVYRY
ncbi:MAG: hypothetical protein ACOCVD_03640 [Bacillota bacterium]